MSELSEGLPICQICAGNDNDMPCAYPSKCLRDKRRIEALEAQLAALEKKYSDLLSDPLAYE